MDNTKQILEETARTLNVLMETYKQVYNRIDNLCRDTCDKLIPIYMDEMKKSNMPIPTDKIELRELRTDLYRKARFGNSRD